MTRRSSSAGRLGLGGLDMAPVYGPARLASAARQARRPGLGLPGRDARAGPDPRPRRRPRRPRPGPRRSPPARRSRGRRPPLVILGGMTQTLASWGGQLRPLAADRSVVVYEARGQGQTELAVTDVSPARHIDDFAALLTALDLPARSTCAASPSAAASPWRSPPTAPSSCAASSSPASAPAAAPSAASSSAPGGPRWPPATSRPSPGSASPTPSAPPTSTATSTCSPAIVKATVERNTYAGVRALFEQTLGDTPRGPSTRPPSPRRSPAPSCSSPASTTASPPPPTSGPSPPLSPAPWTHRVVPGVGHTVPIEAPEVWRAHVLGFLT
jgi:hypothetical protein